MYIVRGVRTTAAGTAMAVPLFHKKIILFRKLQLGAIPAVRFDSGQPKN